MKNKIILITILSGLFLAGYSTFSRFGTYQQLENKSEQKLSWATQINIALKAKVLANEITNPKLLLPPDIHEKQIKKYFHLNNLLFALVLRRTINFALPEIPRSFNTWFTGLLIADKNSKNWSKFLEIKDRVEYSESTGNNPYYLWTDEGTLFLSVVDQNGAGSGEGIMKVFVLSDQNQWQLKGCYYYEGGTFMQEASGYDYFAYTSQLSKHAPESMTECINKIIFNFYDSNIDSKAQKNT